MYSIASPRRPSRACCSGGELVVLGHQPPEHLHGLLILRLIRLRRLIVVRPAELVERQEVDVAAGRRDLGRALVGRCRAHEHRLARLAAQLRRELEVRVAEPEDSPPDGSATAPSRSRARTSAPHRRCAAARSRACRACRLRHRSAGTPGISGSAPRSARSLARSRGARAPRRPRAAPLAKFSSARRTSSSPSWKSAPGRNVLADSVSGTS